MGGYTVKISDCRLMAGSIIAHRRYGRIVVRSIPKGRLGKPGGRDESTDLRLSSNGDADNDKSNNVIECCELHKHVS